MDSRILQDSAFPRSDSVLYRSMQRLDQTNPFISRTESTSASRLKFHTEDGMRPANFLVFQIIFKFKTRVKRPSLPSCPFPGNHVKRLQQHPACHFPGINFIGTVLDTGLDFSHPVQANFRFPAKT